MKKILLIMIMIAFIPVYSFAADEVTDPVKKDPSRLTLNLSHDWVLCPLATVSMLKINMRTEDVSSGIIPGVGYGAIYKGIIGIDMFANLEIGQADEPTAAGVSLVLSIAKYFASGVEMTFAKGREPQYQWIVGAAIPLEITF